MNDFVSKRIVQKKMVPTYLSLEGYAMLKSMADDDMRSMSAFLRVLAFNEAESRGLTPEMFAEEAQNLTPDRR